MIEKGRALAQIKHFAFAVFGKQAVVAKIGKRIAGSNTQLLCCCSIIFGIALRDRSGLGVHAVEQTIVPVRKGQHQLFFIIHTDGDQLLIGMLRDKKLLHGRAVRMNAIEPVGMGQGIVAEIGGHKIDPVALNVAADDGAVREMVIDLEEGFLFAG